MGEKKFCCIEGAGHIGIPNIFARGCKLPLAHIDVDFKKSHKINL